MLKFEGIYNFNNFSISPLHEKKKALSIKLTKGIVF